MWKYVKGYLHFAVLAALFMVGEVTVDLIQPKLMSRIVDEGVLGIGNHGSSDLNLILSLGLFMIIVVILGGCSGSLNNVFVHMTGQNIGNEIRKDCFGKIMMFSFSQMDQYGAGALVTRMTNDITQVQNMVSQFVRGLIRTTMLTLGSIYFMYRLNHSFGYMVLAALPFFVGCMAFCLHRAEPLLPKLQQELDDINAILQEDISGIRVIKAYVREWYEKVRFGRKNDTLVKTQLHILTIFAFMNPVMNAIMYLVVALILMVGKVQVDQGITTPGNIMAAITYTTQMLNGILMLVMLFQTISKGITSWGRIKEILHCDPDLPDGECTTGVEQGGTIEFRDVSFSFQSKGKPVLEHVNLKIHAGETVAILGATGCGKSALAGLIPRFYDVTDGTVLVDGVDVREYRQTTLRAKIAVALQKSELFGTSVGENIAWGNPEASPAEITEAAQIAQADAFIQEKQEGYDMILAERGASLSGGQKQRLSLARAVLKDAEILIMDDATSALDLKTESHFYHALKQTRPHCTKVIVAQRIASVRQADRIVILEQGRVVACDTHEELMKTCGLYRDIYHSQMGEEEE
ncbi:MAG: ABC transporter ATP-binding protein [Eubacteriales bacterium]|nr:ABC transporter ATP-binding protein [Eubacteriales bacterium]